jgi:hypothetical protein
MVEKMKVILADLLLFQKKKGKVLVRKRKKAELSALSLQHQSMSKD